MTVPSKQSVREQFNGLLKDPNFRQLVSRTQSLNVFEAVGATRNELRHSHFLGYLLAPANPHGLGTAFLRRFLTNIAEEHLPLSHPLSSLEFRLKDLEGVEVRREWENIDLLVVGQDEEWVCAVENKVGSSEHSNQLQRYRTTVEAEFPEAESLYLYLTPRGEEPSQEEYAPVSYELVLKATEEAREEREASLGDRTLKVLRDYETIIRRHVIMDSEVAQLCRRVYSKHKQAIDLIIDHIPSALDDAGNHLRSVLGEICDEFDLVEDHHTRTNSLLRFWPEELDKEGLRHTENWTESKRGLLFEVSTRGDVAMLKLMLGKGGDESLRQTIFEWTKRQGRPFKAVSGDEPATWQRLYDALLFEEEELEDLYLNEGKDAAMEAVESRLRDRLNEDLETLVSAIKTSDWYRAL